MRTWRVGTISMGASLIILGVFLFLAQVKGSEMYFYATAWIPLVLVVLGIEIIVYLFFSKQENGFVKYDILSILFVGIIGVCAIGYSVVAATGLLGEFEKAMTSEQVTRDLPSYVEKVPSNVKEIVIDGYLPYVNVETSNDNELHMFGTYTMTVFKGEEETDITAEDVSLVKKIGNKMYITFKPLPQQKGIFHEYNGMNLTIVVPENIQLNRPNGEPLAMGGRR